MNEADLPEEIEITAKLSVGKKKHCLLVTKVKRTDLLYQLLVAEKVMQENKELLAKLEDEE